VINPRIFYLSDKVSAAATANANVTVVESLLDFPDMTKPYPDNDGEFND